jgi:small subunit ribosomal protein S7
MRTGRYQGKKSKSYKVVKDAFSIIEKRTKSNPIQVLVDAIENVAPREETTRLIYGGISVPKSVDIAPARRLDIAIRNICIGAISATRKNKKSMAECLAIEIINASRNDMTSFAMMKKDEVERIAVSAR